MISDDGRNPARSLRDDVRGLMEEAWRPPGYCVPSANTYGQQWLMAPAFLLVVARHPGQRRPLTPDGPDNTDSVCEVVWVAVVKRLP